MKKILFTSLTLENFKGVKSLNIDITAKGLHVLGPNGSGKSTIADAISWVLFGKNAQGQEAEKKGGFALKTIDPATGEAIAKLEHSVTLGLLVDGEKITLSRTLVEDWVKRRGNTEEEFKGHSVTYKVNEVPVKAAEYAARVADICDEGKFQLLTRPDYFFSLKWQDQRDMLVSMVGVPTAADAAAANNLVDVLSLLGDESIIEFKTRKAYELKKLKPELEACPAKIQGIRNVMPPEVHSEEQLKKLIATASADLDKLRKDAAALNTPTDADMLRQQLADQEAAIKAMDGELQSVQDLEREKRDNALAAIQAEKQKVADEWKKSEAAVNTLQQLAEQKQKELDKMAAHISDLREQWMAVNSRKFLRAEGNVVVCPLTQLACGSSDMSESMALRAAEEFENEKTAEKKALEAKAADVKKSINQAQTELQQLNASVVSAQQVAAGAKAVACEFMAEAERKEEQVFKLFDNSTREICLAKKAAANDILEANKLTKQKLAAATDYEIDAETIAAINAQISAKEGEISAYNAEVVQLSQVRKCEAEIGLILSQERNLAEKIAVIEREIFQAETLHHAQMDELERRVNELFGGEITVRLFEKQINGGEAETCQILRYGVKYNDLNTAGKAHAGMALISAVQRNLDTVAPIVIDNAESVTAWPLNAAQMVFLSVANLEEITFTNL